MIRDDVRATGRRMARWHEEFAAVFVWREAKNKGNGEE